MKVVAVSSSRSKRPPLKLYWLFNVKEVVDNGLTQRLSLGSA
jgi:hypothetical protein